MVATFFAKLALRLWLVIGFSAVTTYAVSDTTYADGLGFSYLGVGLLVIYPVATIIATVVLKTRRAAMRVRRQPHHQRLA